MITVLPAEDIMVNRLIESIQNEDLQSTQHLLVAHQELHKKKCCVKSADQQYRISFLQLAISLDKPHIVKLIVELKPLAIFELNSQMGNQLNKFFSLILSTLLSNPKCNQKNSVCFVETLLPKAQSFEDYAKAFLSANLLKLAYPSMAYTFDGLIDDAKEKLLEFPDTDLSWEGLEQFVAHLPTLEELHQAIEQNLFSKQLDLLLTLKPVVPIIKFNEAKPHPPAQHPLIEDMKPHKTASTFLSNIFATTFNHESRPAVSQKAFTPDQSSIAQRSKCY